MQRIPFHQRLAVTEIGAAVGVLLISIATVADGSGASGADTRLLVFFLGVAATVALVGALVTRRWATTIGAALVAGASPLGAILALVWYACASGACD